jgi:hypothetical protein
MTPCCSANISGTPSSMTAFSQTFVYHSQLTPKLPFASVGYLPVVLFIRVPRRAGGVSRCASPEATSCVREQEDLDALKGIEGIRTQRVRLRQRHLLEVGDCIWTLAREAKSRHTLLLLDASGPTPCSDRREIDDDRAQIGRLTIQQRVLGKETPENPCTLRVVSVVRSQDHGKQSLPRRSPTRANDLLEIL